METQDLAQNLIAAYGQLCGLPGLKFEPHGCARLMFEESVAIDLEIDPDAGCIQAYGVLGPVPQDDRETLFRRLLEGNLFGTQTGGATLTIDPARDEILLTRRVDLATATATHLAPFMEEFAGRVKQWRQRLSSGDLIVRGDDSAAPDPRIGMYMRG